MGFDADGNMYPCGTLTLERFKRRYDTGRINVNFKFEDYIHNKEIQATLQELGVEIEKFWYLRYQLSVEDTIRNPYLKKNMDATKILIYNDNLSIE